MAEPDFVDITLEEFLEQNPGYQGYPDKAKRPISAYTVSGSVEWRQIGGKYYLYYTDTNTKVVNDWYYENRKWYFLKPSTGEMAVGWCQVGSYWYYFNGGGAMQKKWYQVGSYWYYFREISINGKPEGSMVIGTEHCLSTNVSTQTRPFYFDYNGVWRKFDQYVLPTDARLITNGFGGSHHGLDLKRTSGSSEALPIYAGTTGTVVKKVTSSSDSSFDSTGYAVILETNIPSTIPGNYLTARYFHMKYAPTVSGTVNASTKIGDTGTTGNSTGVHLHIDISPIAWGHGSVTVNNALDPIAFLHPQNSSGTELDFSPSVYRTR